ncbi:MAG TPA: helix-turn-helix transcriptional regulator [Gemmatimonadales bacterium]|nr:helix-turn-helix transcriptional regulator [Gemmatimonadales bacterium]
MARISPTLTTGEILRELGHRLRAYRLQQNQTLEHIAEQAGVSYRTAQRAEAGENPTLSTVVKLLRALGRLDALENFMPQPLVSPLEMVKLAGKVRERATGSRGGSAGNDGDRTAND